MTDPVVIRALILNTYRDEQLSGSYETGKWYAYHEIYVDFSKCKLFAEIIMRSTFLKCYLKLEEIASDADSGYISP